MQTQQQSQIDFTRPASEVVNQFEQLSIDEISELAQTEGAIAFINARDEYVALGNQFKEFLLKTPVPLKGSPESIWIAETIKGLIRLTNYYQAKVNLIETAVEQFKSITETGDLAVN